MGFQPYQMRLLLDIIIHYGVTQSRIEWVRCRELRSSVRCYDCIQDNQLKKGTIVISEGMEFMEKLTKGT